MCVKIAGREAGNKCVVVELLDDTYVVVCGPKVRRRRCNINHLEPLDRKLDIPQGASEEEVLRAFEAAGLTEPKSGARPKPSG